MMRIYVLICFFILTAWAPVMAHVANDDVPSELKSGLPVIYIDTKGNEIIKEEYVDCEISISENDTLVVYPASIKYRGNSTFFSPKKPYNIKFKSKVGCAGLAPAKKFTLLANWFDLSLCRTSVGMKLSQLAGVEWPVHCDFVELVVNGTHVGNYNIAESIEIGKNRIDIDKTRGVVVEYRYDSQLDEDNGFFRTDRLNWLFEFKDPNGTDLTEELYELAKLKINDFEAHHLSLKSTDKSIEEFIDLNSFVKWYYVKNLLQMDECNRYYVIENESARIKMGPLWDFDMTIGVSPYYKHYDGCYVRNKLYFRYMGKNKYFLSKVAEYHFENRDRIEAAIMDYYDEITDRIRISQQVEESIWHLCETYNTDWETELSIDKEFLHKTFLWLDDYLIDYYDFKTGNDVLSVTERENRNMVFFDISGKRVVNSFSDIPGGVHVSADGRKYLKR